MSEERIAEEGLTSAFSDRLVSDKEIATVLGIGRSTWWKGVAEGLFPQPVRLGSRCTRWRKSDIDRLIQHGTDTDQNST